MGILDDDLADADEPLRRTELIDAIREFGEPTEQEFIAYRQAIRDLAKRHRCTEYEAISNIVEDGEIVTLLMRQGIAESRAWDILDPCAERWKPEAA